HKLTGVEHERAVTDANSRLCLYIVDPSDLRQSRSRVCKLHTCFWRLLHHAVCGARGGSSTTGGGNPDILSPFVYIARFASALHHGESSGEEVSGIKLHSDHDVAPLINVAPLVAVMRRRQFF